VVKIEKIKALCGYISLCCRGSIYGVILEIITGFQFGGGGAFAPPNHNKASSLGSIDLNIKGIIFKPNIFFTSSEFNLARCHI